MRKQRRKIKMKNNTTKNAESLEAVTHTHTHTLCLPNWWTVWRATL
jgi:hypothetical protein